MEGPLFYDPLENVLAHSPAESRIYLGSPSLTFDPSGDIIASHDFFGPSSPRDGHGREHLTRILRSEDEGATWRPLCKIEGAFWSSLFTHDGGVYLLGCSAHYGDIVIRRSDDAGETWTTPRDEDSGLLFRGGPGLEPPNYHCAPVPVVQFDGRIWRAFEDNFSGQWAYFGAVMLSADADSDLLCASSWRMSNQVHYDRETDPPDFDAKAAGWLEGNAVVSPEGEVWNVLRVNSVPLANWVAVAQVSESGKSLSFDPAGGYIEFPGGMSKFTIRFDRRTGRYLTLSNQVYNPRNPWQRNHLVLASSRDLLNWRTDRLILYAYEDERLVKKECKIGFQYADWIFDGEDLLVLVRTAYDGAHNFHDANHTTFHRVCGYADLVERG